MAAALMVAATALETISVLREGRQQQESELYSSGVAGAQAEAVKQAAEFESKTLTASSELGQQRIARRKERAISSQRALFAKSGVRIDEGSPLEVQADTAAQFELDLATERYNLAAGLEKIRYESQVSRAQLESESEYRRKLAKSYRTASFLKAGTTLLAGSYLAGKQAGFFGSKKKVIPAAGTARA